MLGRICFLFFFFCVLLFYLVGLSEEFGENTPIFHWLIIIKSSLIIYYPLEKNGVYPLEMDTHMFFCCPSYRGDDNPTHTKNVETNFTHLTTQPNQKLTFDGPWCGSIAKK